MAQQHRASAPDGGTGPGHHLNFWEGLALRALEAEAMGPVAELEIHIYRNYPRYRHVLAALAMSGDEATQLMIAETGATVEAVIGGLLPGLLDIAKWVGLGAVIGGGIGALGGPADEITVPGGALAGAEIGLWVANSLGLGKLLVGMLKNLGNFVLYATDAAEVAWYAGDDPRVPAHTDEVTASKLFAAALAELWMALLTALVAEAMKRAAEAVHAQLREGTPTRSALNQVAKTIADSKLGQKAGEWFRDNFDKIQEAVRRHQEQQQKRLEQGQDSGNESLYNQASDIKQRLSSSPRTGPEWRDSEGRIKYPENNGFHSPPIQTSLEPGTLVDRYGHERGRYLSPAGTPFEQRAIPVESLDTPYTVYRVVKTLPVQAGPIEPWFGQPGMGTQYLVEDSVSDLINKGYLERVPAP